MHARIYDFTLGANGMQRLPVVGQYFKILSATGQVNVIADTGAQLDVMPGQGMRDYSFTALTILDKTGAANSGKILIGFRSMVDDRITGEVSIIEGGALRTKAGIAFSASNKVTAAAGQYPHVQLWNPAASGKRVLVSEIGYDASAVGDVAVRWSNAALPSMAATPNGVSKLIGGASSSAEVRYDLNAVVQGNPLYGVGADTKIALHKLSEPIILMPGYGLSVVNVTLATSVRGNFQFFEEVI